MKPLQSVAYSTPKLHQGIDQRSPATVEQQDGAIEEDKKALSYSMSVGGVDNSV